MKKIAVIGSGISGLTVAYYLQDLFDVTIFEKNDYLGGHASTYILPKGPDAGLGIDTGFIVFNKQFRDFWSLLQDLKIKINKSNMSFGYESIHDRVQYSGKSANSLFANRKNIFSFSHYKFLFNIYRYSKKMSVDLERGILKGLTLAEYFKKQKIPFNLVRDYFFPIGATLWSCSFDHIREFPAEFYAHFFLKYQLLSPQMTRPQWFSVLGGSQEYIKKMTEQFRGKIRSGIFIDKIFRENKIINIVSKKHSFAEEFDIVVVATHADQALKLFNKPSKEEREALGEWKYSKNKIVLHSDPYVMPSNKHAWASWNARKLYKDDTNFSIQTTYFMNLLQQLNTKKNYFITLNPMEEINEKTILFEAIYEHPLYNFNSLNSWKKIREINGANQTYFCGSYFSYGFHEDAMNSGLDVVDLLKTQA